MGAVGCVAIFLLGVLVKDEPTGWIAAALLAVNPLYRLHAHRAMSEAPCEAFMLLSLALGLWAWRAILTRPSAAAGLAAMIGAGLLAGLSILAKFNGILALVCFAAWCLLGLALSGIASERKLVLALGTVMAGLSAWFIFVELNPSMTAHPAGRIPVRLHYLADMDPWERFLFLVDHRRDMARGQQRMFPHNALESLADRASVVAVQGFGRFGPLGPRKSDSTRRYDLSQDFGALLWLPLVAGGPGRRRSRWDGDRDVRGRRRRPGPRRLGGRVRGHGDGLPADGLGPLPVADPGPRRAPGLAGPRHGLGLDLGPDRLGPGRAHAERTAGSGSGARSSSSCSAATPSSGTRATGTAPAG